MPNEIHTLDSRGFAYLRLGEWDRAITDYNAVLTVNARQAGSLYGRGVIKQKKGDATGAAADMAAAKENSPGIADEWAKYGVK